MAKRGRPRALAEGDEVRVVAEVDRVRKVLKDWRFRQGWRRHEAKFTTTGEHVAKGHAELRSWPTFRRQQAAADLAAERDTPDAETLQDVAWDVETQDPAMGRALAGTHVAGRDFHIPPASWPTVYAIAARRLTKKLGREILPRAVERAYKDWRSWSKQQPDYIPDPNNARLPDDDATI